MQLNKGLVGSCDATLKLRVWGAFVRALCAVRVTPGKPESLPQTGLLKKR